MTMPLVAVGGHLKRLERETAGWSNRTIQIRDFFQARAQIVVHRHLDTGLTCEQHCLGLNRNLELDAE